MLALNWRCRTADRGSKGLTGPCRLWTSRAPRPQHEGGNRRQRMTIDLPQIDCSARSASRAEHVEPRRPRNQRGPDLVGDHEVLPAASRQLFSIKVINFAQSNHRGGSSLSTRSNTAGMKALSNPVPQSAFARPCHPATSSASCPSWNTFAASAQEVLMDADPSSARPRLLPR